MQKIEVLEYDELASLIDKEALKKFRDDALNPDHPVLHGCTENPDIFFQTREAVNKFYLPVPDVVQSYMDDINKLTGRTYQLFNYYGSTTAEDVIVAMGSSCSVIRETIEYQNAHGGNYGLLEVHLYRPFSNKHLLEAIPKSVKRIAVLDRTKEPGASGEPLYLDVRSAFYGRENAPLIVGGRYGIGSKDFTPAHVMAVYKNLAMNKPADGFTVGIHDDVTFLSLPPYLEEFDSAPEGTTACKFWGLGSDGTVSANKSAIKIIGDHTNLYTQAYFAYDSKKSGGLTVSHLRFGKKPIQSSYLINRADFVACHNQSYVHTYDLLEDIKPGGRFLLNCVWNQEEFQEQLPAALKRTIAEKSVEFYIINAVKIAQDVGLGGRINMVMQAAFFQLAKILPVEEAVAYLKSSVEKSYGKRGMDVVEMNWQAIDAGIANIVRVDVPVSWRTAVDAPAVKKGEPVPDFIEKFMFPVTRQQGDKLPVSIFNGRENGSFPMGTSQYEKRGISLEVPFWKVDKCIQCNQCSFVCPHAVLRPKLLSEEQTSAAPAGISVKKAIGFENKNYTMAISALDCTGCGNCIAVCPVKGKALEMVSLSEYRDGMEKNWEYLKHIEVEDLPQSQRTTLKGSQFLQPFLEFSGACAGCGETPYAKLITQLYGDRMILANTAGCVVVWGNSSPSTAYTVNSKGHGPGWGYSLFENEAEFALGLYMGSKAVRNNLANMVRNVLHNDLPTQVSDALKAWLEGMDRSEETRERAAALEEALKPFSADPTLAAIYERKDYFVLPSYWAFGGDGWAYDIGFGGLDHVLASGENINIFVLDTEVYSNTGGQSSKSTPAAAVAKFAASGKETKKKDLGRMAMSYGYVYVAQVCMGADRNQTLKAIAEAEAYNGPSLIIGYAPCINHGIKAGMGSAQLQQKRAVEAGYWALYRYNPDREKLGENPFVLDSKEPTADFKEYLLSETRFASLAQDYPEQAEKLYKKAEQDAMDRNRYYKYLSENKI
ncbi:MAG: nifJ2 [Firmicutes bacterium]|nr:nifJ2 [Bacillota bacterium]